MKKSLELKENRSELVSKLETIHGLASTEKRELTNEESTNVDNFLSDISDLDTKIERAENLEKELRNNAKLAGASVSTPKADKRYSIQKAVNGYMNGNLEGLEKEYDAEARRNNVITGVGIPLFAMGETRNNPQLTSNASGMIETEVGPFAETLQNKTVLGDLATWMYGLSGDMKLPTLSGTTAGFGTEVANATDAATTINSETLQPKKLSAYMDISKMLIQQTNASVENIIRNDIQNAIASVLEGAVLGRDAGAGAVPQGVFSAGTATTAAAATRAKIVDLIKKLEQANSDGGRTAFITTPQGKAVLRNLPADVISTSGASNPLFSMDDKIMGIDARVTQNVSTLSSGTHTNGLVLAKWDDAVIGQFGSALDVVVDPYTKSISGEVRLVVLSYWDVIYRRATSFQYQYIS
jgi:HK97 family phage major capsid protein